MLTAGRRPGRRAFTPDELAMLAGFANQACLAIEFADARAQQQLVALFNDRDRIAADLHDHVIKQLFGTGLTLQGIAANVGGDHARRIRDTIGTLDTTIGQIRASIFALTARDDPPGTSVPGPDTRRRRRTHPRARQHTQRALQRTLRHVGRRSRRRPDHRAERHAGRPRPRRTPRDRHRRHRRRGGSPWRSPTPLRLRP